MELFEDAMERVRLRYLFVIGGYVVMPEHVHLLVNEPKRALLCKAIQALKLSVSMRRQQRPFWQAHYYDFNISTHEKFVEKLRYIHRNPVRRGLVAQPQDWKWSSYRHYQTGLHGTVEIESEWTARERGWQLPEWMRCRQFDSSSPVPKSEGGTGGILIVIGNRHWDRGHPPFGDRGYVRQRMPQVPGEVSTTTEDGCPRCLAFGHLGDHEPRPAHF
jgi:putative transposase